MGRLSLHIEAVQTISADLSGEVRRNIRNAVRRFRLDLEVSSGGVVEVLVEELQDLLEHSMRNRQPSLSHIVRWLSDIAERNWNAGHDDDCGR